MSETRRLNDHLYVELALEFARHADRSPYNVSFERPAMLELLGDPAGKDVMDVGCGSGTLLLQLAQRSPKTLAGVDASPAMAGIARSRLDGRARIWVHDVRKPFEPAERNTIDAIVCSLVLDYIEDWVAGLRNCRSLLRPSGSMYFSAAHPADVPPNVNASECVLIREPWPSFGIDVTRFYRPLEQMEAAIMSAGFVLRRTVEPRPAASLLREDPGLYTRLLQRPPFLLFEIQNPASST